MIAQPISLRFAPSRRNQRGVALIVSLILLVVVTLLGLAGMQNTSLQERMSGNMYDRSVAMQSAEAALRAAEAAISANPNIGVDCTANLCDVIPANTFNGTDGTWTNVAAPFLVNAAVAGGATPQYHIQFVAQGNQEDPLGQSQSANSAQYGGSGAGIPVNFYRITVRSAVPTANGTRAFVVLQSTVYRFI